MAEVSWRSDQEPQNQNLNTTSDESSVSKKRKLDSTMHTSANIKKEFTEKQQVIIVKIKLKYLLLLSLLLGN